MNTKSISAIVALLTIVIICFGAFKLHELNVAHSTFDDYYAFRGCVQLVEKTDTYGTCKIASGETIKIVLIDGKWYLDGDGPGIW